jgi:hypothetical protein
MTKLLDQPDKMKGKCWEARSGSDKPKRARANDVGVFAKRRRPAREG